MATLTAVDIPAVSREDKDKTNLLGEVKEGTASCAVCPECGSFW